MANETYWEVTFIDVDNTEKTETFNNEVDFSNRFMNIWEDLQLPIIHASSGSNA